MVVVATQVHALRNQALQRMEAQDDRFSRLQPVVLRKNSPGEVRGRFLQDGCALLFVEDITNHRVTLTVPKKQKFGWLQFFLDTQVL